MQPASETGAARIRARLFEVDARGPFRLIGIRRFFLAVLCYSAAVVL
jgi:hypothetical protein